MSLGSVSHGQNTTAGLITTTRLRIALVLKTSEGGLWTLPHVDEMLSRGHHVIAVLPPEPGRLRSALEERDVPIVSSAFPFRFRPVPATLVGLARLRAQLHDVGADVLLYHLYASALATRIATLGFRTPRVQMVAGPLHLEVPLIRTVERVLVRLDTTTIAGSEYTARIYRRLGLPADRLRVIPYGVDTRRFRPVGSGVGLRVRAQHGVPAFDFLVVMIAVVYGPKRSVHAGHGIKGHEVLLRAWSDFHRDHPNSHLLLVGGGFDLAGEAHRRDLIESFRIGTPSSGITWLDTVQDVRQYYEAADVSVSPSLSDNHGAADEAGSMAVPSIVSDAGGLPETVEGNSGWVVPRGDVPALTAALRQAHLDHVGGRLPAKGHRSRALMLSRFDADRSSALVTDVVEEAAGGRRPTARPVTIRMFSEIRFGCDLDGRWGCTDQVYGDRQLSRYRSAGRELILVGRADPRPDADAIPFHQVDVVPLPYYVGVSAFLRALPRLVPSVARAVADADLIILRVPGAVGFLAACCCWSMRRRYAVEVVGDPAEVLAVGTLGPLGRRTARLAGTMMRHVVGRASASVFVTRSSLQRLYPPERGTPTTGISDIRLESNAFAKASRRPHHPPYRLMTIGSQEQHYKGHDVLLRAIRRMVDDGIDVTATVVGGGRMHDEIVGLAEDLGITDRVCFTGKINDRDRINSLLDEASLFVLPSRTEGLPRALIEAMARALPAVATDVGGIPELLDPSCLVPVDDDVALAVAIDTLLSDPDRWSEQSRRNLAVARGFEVAVLDEAFATWLSSVPAAACHARGRRP